MDPMRVCDFHLLIFYGFSSKLLEPQFKLDDLRNHFCNSVWGQHFLRSNFKINTQKIARDFFKTFHGACSNPKWKKSRKFVDATL